jgi:plasmid stability protein
MNTALNIRDVGQEIKAALAMRAKAEGRPMAEVAKAILAEALAVTPETPADVWKRENAEGIVAYNRRAEEGLRRAYAISAVPMPQFSDDQ